ncbi:hypothetical protein ALP8811_02807 [Aliiroseovarius pelagivivens]|uniref:DUF1468 domain-containing protein n=1 Tax=Aliiroseovarius pelagivivens TaxID=1639690 RepID=A0A2R8AS90_9RHOB|nr:tripartite tricarboxylate transporter TctB family protein [Aliiroseovarius pelagivivens]SPF78875.1 hypothetical protein ALP8811_02807 [Aliiroseovarius pelagivivens]
MASLSVAFAFFLAVNLPFQTTWVPRTKLFAQPAFWPSVAVSLMVVFSLMHLVGSLVSERIAGRMQEIMMWVKSLEFVCWFMGYVLLVPLLGYLPMTIVFTQLLTRRLGYRGWTWIASAMGVALGVVVVFKGVLQVKIPAGAVYDLLPAGAARNFIMIYF